MYPRLGLSAGLSTRRHKSMKTRLFKYTKRTIADEAGVPYRTVLEDIRRGILDPGRFSHVCAYVISARLYGAPYSRHSRCLS